MLKIKQYCTILLLLCISINANAATKTEPSWISQLKQCDIIDSISSIDAYNAADSNVTVYHLFYHQPVEHAQPNGEQMPMRCVLMIRNDNDLATCNNEMFMGGYAIEYAWGDDAFDYFTVPEFAEAAMRYHANLFIPEHRYFKYSSPENCWEKLDHLNAKEASQDFHALIEALKTVFSGKWLLTGGSKGGTVTAMQHAFFPDDADIFVPVSAPLCKTLSDYRLHKYIVENGWEESTRKRMNDLTRSLIEDNKAADIYTEYYAQTKEYGQTPLADTIRSYYYQYAMTISYIAHTDIPREQIDDILDNNKDMWDAILKYSPDVSKSQLRFEYVNNCDLDASDAWEKHLKEIGYYGHAKKYTGKKKISISKDTWNINDDNPCVYQDGLELGDFEFDIRYLYPEEEKQHFADSLQQVYMKTGLKYFRDYPYMTGVKYDDYALFSFVEQKTKEATKPILFLYGEDDPWTGAAIGDEFINGDNVCKYILKAQKHCPTITNDKTSLQPKLWAFIDKYMNNPTGIQTVTTNISTATARKCIANDRIIIMKDGKNYNAIGQSIRK